MDEWLQLTEEDVERARRLARKESPEPEVLTIRPEELPDESAQAAAQEAAQEAARGPVTLTGEPITVTADDLRPAAPQETAARKIQRLERLMFRLLNATRQHHLPSWVGTAELRWHDDLAAVSRQHSADMLRRQYVAHVTPEGITAAQRLQRRGVRYVACGENIGIVYGEAAHDERAVHDIHNAFINQPRSLTNHRGNLLNPIWTHVGIGIAYNPDGALVATQSFISAPGRRLRGR